MSDLTILLMACGLLHFGCSGLDNRLHSLYNDQVLVDDYPDDWNQADRIKLTDKNGLSDNIMYVYSRWDNQNLYFLFEVKDHNLRAFQQDQDHKELYLDDMVEILIDPMNDRDSCWNIDDIVYHVNILGVKKDDRGNEECSSDATWNGIAQYKVNLEGSLNDSTNSDTGYSVEMKITWEELGVMPKNGMSVSINFANGDNDGKGRQLFDWVGAWPYRSPYSFGFLELEK